MSEERSQPSYCPYCGGRDLRPALAERTYHCGECDRLFTIEFVRHGAPKEAADDGS